MRLAEALGLPQGAHQSAAIWLRQHYLHHARERERITAARERKELLQDAGEKQMETLIERVFRDAENKRAHKALLKYTKWDNALKRIHGEGATVYLVPPTRKVAKGNEKYQQLIKEIRQDEIMRRGNLWLNVFNDVLFWFRVRMMERGSDTMPPVLEPVLEVLSPDQFWAVGHPDDPTHLVAIIRDITPRDGKLDKPHYDVWTNEERFKINGNFVAMTSTVQENPFGVIPGYFAHREPRDTELFDSRSGDDVVAGQRIAWLMNTILVQEAKSISKQAVWIGDPSGIPSGQAQRTEVDLHAGEGTGFAQIDRGVDLKQFRETADHVIERPAANHGLPQPILRHQGASSGFEIMLLERRLKEIRTQDVEKFRTHERGVVTIIAAVLEQALPDAWFSLDGWSIDFHEPEIPLSPADELALFETRRRLNLTSTIEYIRAKDPDLLTDDDATALIAKRVRDELIRNQLGRPLAAISGSSNQNTDEMSTAEENGARGPAVRDGKPQRSGEEPAPPRANGRGGAA